MMKSNIHMVPDVPQPRTTIVSAQSLPHPPAQVSPQNSAVSTSASVMLAQPSAIARAVNRLRWRFNLWSAELGLAGQLGVGLAVLGTTFYLSSVVPGSSDLRDADEKMALMRERVMQEAGRSGQMPTGPDSEIDRFYRFLPPDSSISESLRKVHRVSADHGLVLEQAEYRVAAEGQGRVLRYEVGFPVVGTYPQIRAFLRQVAQEVPVSVPDKVNFEYQDVKTGQVRASVRLLIYTRRDA